jgi:hypothetical protein
METLAMLRELHDRALRRIDARDSGFAIASIDRDSAAEDISFHKGTDLAGTYHGGPHWLSGTELKEAMILSIAQGRIVACAQRPGAASPATFYRMDIVRMIRERRLRGANHEVEALERYRASHPEVFV